MSSPLAAAASECADTATFMYNGREVQLKLSNGSADLIEKALYGAFELPLRTISFVHYCPGHLKHTQPVITGPNMAKLAPLCEGEQLPRFQVKQKMVKATRPRASHTGRGHKAASRRPFDTMAALSRLTGFDEAATALAGNVSNSRLSCGFIESGRI